jgi:hypothetical protein
MSTDSAQRREALSGGGDAAVRDAPEGAETTSEQAPDLSHVLRRGVVFDRLRILYIPVPKAGCTAVLWSLARLAGLPPSVFADSAGREVSRALTIHDMGRWPDSFRFGRRSPEERERLVAADDWLRFTVVRHPFRRLWSAWQSKVLLAEPQFVAKFSSQPWFPDPARSAAEVLKAFRDFMDALEGDPDLVHSDVHWAPQADLIEYRQIPYDHVGRVETLDATLDRVREHLREMPGAVLGDLPLTNVSTLPYADELFTETDVRFLTEMYGDDIREFGYEPPRNEALGGSVPGAWMATVDRVAPALEELRDRNERIADLHDVSKARQEQIRELRRRKNREEKLRREEHRRNQHLQKRLQADRDRLQRMRNSRTWRYTAPLRRAGARVRRARRALRRLR